MQLISPISNEAIAPYLGRPVCVVLQDESCYYGYLGGIQGGQLMLTGGSEKAGILSTNAHKAKTKLVKMSDMAKTSAYGYGYGGYGYGRAFGLELALISLLFLLPFFFI